MISMPKEVKSANSNRPTSMTTTAAVASASASSSANTRSASTWSAKDDETLMSARASGLNWQPIASKHFPTKTANACRKRHERLMEKRNSEDWEGVKLETLAREYMNVRREMWSMLASRVGEKWALVEAKCMEKGLKNLQQAHRSAQRKERDEGHPDAAQSVEQAQGGYPLQRGGPSIQSMLSLSPAFPPQP
ncbi:hypothetical protein AOQ84DRAFT_124527 [Glonium stellatum]|uniref:Myb-like domain-containing protein n=1 Tax=Glonium stellatum TaxID=574774 RepID=A0A8E2ET61_9PEZI|nr:hypothetical protein AOQ84DRAFT_124527 [Glonium stellatum]